MQDFPRLAPNSEDDVYAQVYIYICLCVYMSACVCAFVDVNAHVYAYMWTCIRMHHKGVHVRICVYVCVSTYV